MSRLSATTSLEMKILDALRALNLPVPCVGMMERADAGEQKEQDTTSAQVRVWNFAQTNEAFAVFTASAEIRLIVEQSESANGGMFFDAHELIALWLEGVMLGDGCVALSTDEADVDGLQRTGGDKDFDSTVNGWYATWNFTIYGRVKSQTQEA